MKISLPVLVCLAFLLYAQTVKAAAVALPPVNLGDTSFEDGVGAQGWFAEQYNNYYHADQFNDSQGGEIPGSNRLTALTTITHVIYLSNLRPLDAYYGGEFLLPLAYVDTSVSSGAMGGDSGVGDLVLSPCMLQWTDQKLFGLKYFHRLDLTFNLPTGEYNRNRAVTVGHNLFSVNPYYAFTLYPTKKLEFSARLHYLWNSQNNAPFTGLGVKNTQPGQAFHANYASSYEIFKGFRIGINGYVLQQFTQDRINGQSLANSEERVFAIGPGLVYKRNKLWIYLNSYFEFGAQNRPQGRKFTFRISKAF